MRPPAERNIQSNQLTISHEGGLALEPKYYLFLSLNLAPIIETVEIYRHNRIIILILFFLNSQPYE